MATMQSLRGVFCSNLQRWARSLQCSCSDTSISGLQQRGLATTEALDQDVPMLQAWPRDKSGSHAAGQFRKEGKTPAILFSLPSNASQLIYLDSKQVKSQVQNTSRKSFLCRLFDLEVHTPSGDAKQVYRVLPRNLHVNAVTDIVENICLMHCPPDRMVTVDVPIKVLSEDAAPGIKKGGYVNSVRKAIKLRCNGASIPPCVEVDLAGLEIGDRVMLLQLRLQDGVEVLETELDQPVVKIAGRARRE